MIKKRADHEIKHGEFLASGDTESLWGWGTPAGKLRAKRRAKLITEAAELNSSMRVLEIGCGTGMFTEMFSKSGCSIVAVDISRELLQIAGERKLPADRVQFVNKRFEDCAVDGPFDAIIGSSVLHHLELEQSLSKIHELLKPRGIMSFAEPNMLNPQIFIERTFRQLFPRISEDETAFVRFKLKNKLFDAGFSDCEITPFDWLHPAVPRGFIPFVSKLGTTLEMLPILREFSGSVLISSMKQ